MRRTRRAKHHCNTGYPAFLMAQHKTVFTLAYFLDSRMMIVQTTY